VIAALLSRSRVFVLRALTEDEVALLLRRALEDSERGLGALKVDLDAGVIETIARFANGDARTALNVLELAVSGAPRIRDKAGDERGWVDLPLVQQTMQRRTLLYDKAGEEHYNLISALHKSMRNSDPDASIYWLARMVESGEDPLYIARRLVRFASEDIGLAEPGALAQAMAAKEAFHFVGIPEGKLALAQAVVYLALAPKSNAVYLGYAKAAEDALKDVSEPVPLHLRNAVTRPMKSWGYGKGYDYAHNHDEKTTAMECLPESLQGRRYYRPTDEGFEKRLKARIEEIEKIKEALRKTRR
jgi:putative ATPase